MKETSVQLLEGRNFDVLIVGAGANGSAAAEMLAKAGYSVLLADKSDFGSGTSSRSSRMLHCGFRSLEGAAGKTLLQHLTHLPDRLTLVKGAREALQARADFIGAMPNRVRPVTMVTPLYHGGVSGLQMDAAATLLWLLGTGGIPLDYRRLTPAKLGDLPFAEWLRQRDDLAGVVTFRDYVFDWPERVCVDQTLAAEQFGAVVCNYTTVGALHRMPDGQWSATLRDAATGTQATIETRQVLNLAGPWIDDVVGLAAPKIAQRIASSKGVQIAVELPERFRDFGLAAATDKGAFVCIPSQGLHLIGATNSKFSGDPTKATASEAEVEELLARANALLPGIDLNRRSVRYAIAGIRPGSLGAAGRVIHDHADDGLAGLVSVTGGTVAMSRQTARALLGLVKGRFQPSQSIPGVHDTVRTASVTKEEYARTIADLALRRTGEAWSANFDEKQLHAFAVMLGDRHGWDQARIEEAKAEFRAELAELYRREPTQLSPQ
ncbi:FAD dependent oxidoreductase [Nitratireductor aquibiodomus RA22]|uniref:FAD dependent oxidoreductase n=1 Tax=Nitratireductor aquibiodomus RA22 TaxID=1189611 RepID=I5BV73_9HYPH|nr:FAD-dependent oxidoreductase [Nitratireductor aquibiodomus]EIM73475.1 FAD dependent oxidoreductase [Nitratireductor aquibiodomus RA22]